MSQVTLNTIVEQLVSRVEPVRELLGLKGIELFDYVNRDNKEVKVVARKEHMLLANYLLENDRLYTNLVTAGIKFCLMSQVRHLPQTVAISQLAGTIRSMEPKTRFRLAAMVFNMMRKAGVYKTIEHITADGYSEHMITVRDLPKYIVDSLGSKVIKGPQDHLPKEWSSSVKGGFAGTKRYSGGHLKKHPVQADNTYEVLNKLQDVAYVINSVVASKFQDYMLESLDGISEQAKYLNEVEKHEGKTLYFAHNFGPDNGRVYCEGSYLGLQTGIRKFLFEYANKGLYDEIGRAFVVDAIKDLESKSVLKPKDIVQLYIYKRDLSLSDVGIPVGTIFRKDSKLSG